MEEVEKAAEQDKVSSTKQKGEENPKAEESLSPEPTALKPGGVEDKQIEAPAVEAPKTPDAPEVCPPHAETDGLPSSKEHEEEKPKAESSLSPAIPSNTSGDTDDKPTEPPVVEVEKAADTPIVESRSLSSTKEKEEKKQKSEDSPSPAAPSPQLGDTDDKLVEPSVVKVEKVADDPVSEVPQVESHSLSSTKENEEEKPKAGDSTTPAILGPGDTEDKLIETPVVDVEKSPDAPGSNASLFVEQGSDSSAEESGKEVNTEVDNSQTSKTLSPESEGVEEKVVEPTVAEVEKTVDAPVSDVPLVNETTKGKDHIPDSATTSASELAPNPVKDQDKDSVKEAPKQPSIEIVEKGQEEETKVVDVHDSAVETIDKLKEPLDSSSVQELEAAAVEVIEESKMGSTAVGKPEPEVTDVEKKTEPLELTEQLDKKGDNVEPKGSVEDKTIRGEKSLADNVEYSTSLKVVETEKDAPPSLIESSEVSIDQKAKSDPKDEGVSSIPAVTESIVGEEKKKEVSKIDAVEKAPKEVPPEIGKVGEEDAAEKKNVTAEDSTQLLKEDGVNRASPKDEVAEKPLEGAARDVEPAGENKVADSKYETKTSAETDKEEKVERKKEEDTSAIHETPEESKKPEVEAKEEEAVKTEAEKLEKVDDIAKSDQNPEPESVAKDGKNTETPQDLSKGIPTKPTQKQSNNIISKVKHSLVKAKKAIIGKSPNSKTPASEAKGDIKVK